MTLTGHELDTPLDPGSPEWLATVSASQIATIAGLTPPEWETAHSLWHKKAGTLPSKPQTDAQGRGHEFEPLIRQWFAKAHADCEITQTGTWVHNLRDWQTANPDGLIHGTGCLDDDPTALLEIKTSADMRDWAQGIPPYYQAQAQWQMDVTGLRQVIFAVCGPFELFDRRPREIPLDYDPRAAARLREMAIRFTQSLELGIEPDPDYTASPDREALRWQHRTVEAVPGVELPDDIAIPYLTALAETKRIDGDKARWSAEVARFLGDAKTATWRGTTIGGRKAGRGDNPPVFSAAPKLADKAPDLLNPQKAA